IPIEINEGARIGSPLLGAGIAVGSALANADFQHVAQEIPQANIGAGVQLVEILIVVGTTGQRQIPVAGVEAVIVLDDRLGDGGQQQQPENGQNEQFTQHKEPPSWVRLGPRRRRKTIAGWANSPRAVALLARAKAFL